MIVVNLESGMPTVEGAMIQLRQTLLTAKSRRVNIVKLIHGYGSSGTGGRIRTESRKYLARLKSQGKIRGFIPGEAFSIFEEDTRQAFLRCTDLRQDRDLDRYNNGVTFILL